MNKKRNNIKILLMMTMALSAFSLNTNAMENKQNATKPNILNKSFENKKPENNIFENLNSNNKLKKSNSVENINNNLSLNENKQNATKPNILNKSFKNKKPENNIFENLNSNNKLKKSNNVENINNNLSLNENKQKDNDKDIKKINFKLKDINSTNFDNLFKPNILNKSFKNKRPENEILKNLNILSRNYKNSKIRILNEQEYEKLIKDLNLIKNNIEHLNYLAYDLNYSSIDRIIDKIQEISDVITKLITYNIENNNIINENLLNLTENTVKEIIFLIKNIIDNYENPNKIDKQKLMVSLNKRIKKTENLIQLEKLQKDYMNLFIKNKDNLKNTFESIIEKLDDQLTNLLRLHDKLNDYYSYKDNYITQLKITENELKTKKQIIPNFILIDDMSIDNDFNERKDKIKDKILTLSDEHSNLYEIKEKVSEKYDKVKEEIDTLKYMLDENILPYKEEDNNNLKIKLENLKKQKNELEKELKEIYKQETALISEKDKHHNNKKENFDNKMYHEKLKKIKHLYKRCLIIIDKISEKLNKIYKNNNNNYETNNKETNNEETNNDEMHQILINQLKFYKEQIEKEIEEYEKDSKNNKADNDINNIIKEQIEKLKSYKEQIKKEIEEYEKNSKDNMADNNINITEEQIKKLKSYKEEIGKELKKYKKNINIKVLKNIIHKRKELVDKAESGEKEEKIKKTLEEYLDYIKAVEDKLLKYEDDDNMMNCELKGKEKQINEEIRKEILKELEEKLLDEKTNEQYEEIKKEINMHNKNIKSIKADIDKNNADIDKNNKEYKNNTNAFINSIKNKNKINSKKLKKIFHELHLLDIRLDNIKNEYIFKDINEKFNQIDKLKKITRELIVDLEPTLLRK